ncbi:12271_t:CDS:1, partial [Racocetra persica]
QVRAHAMVRRIQLGSHDNINEFEPTLWCGAFNSLHMTTGRVL